MENNNASTNPIFLQAGWRAGSTYAYNAFRRSKELHCLAKPFHHDLAKSKEQRKKDSKSAKQIFSHTFVQGNMWKGYPTVNGQVPSYNWRFATDDLILNEGDEHAAIENYIKGLLEHARRKKKRPVIQFNRGALRANWLKRKFNACSIYINRSPINILASYNRIADQKGPYYMACQLGILGQNRSHPILSEMADHMDTPDHDAKSFNQHYLFYRRCINALSDQQTKDITGFFWALNLINATNYADTVLDMERTIDNGRHLPAEFQNLVEEATGAQVDFSDLKKEVDNGILTMTETAKKITRKAAESLNPNWKRLNSLPLSPRTRAQLQACIS